MSTATLPPPSPAAPGPRSTPPPRTSPSAPSPNSGTSATPRSIPGFGENAIAGPSRPPPPSSIAGSIPSFPPGSLQGLNGGDLSQFRPGQNVGPIPNGQPSLEQAALQSRIMLAQRAMKATMMQTARPPGSAQGDHGVGGQDTSKMADAIGLLQNMNGSNKEAMMKQASLSYR